MKPKIKDSRIAPISRKFIDDDVLAEDFVSFLFFLSAGATLLCFVFTDFLLIYKKIKMMCMSKCVRSYEIQKINKAVTVCTVNFTYFFMVFLINRSSLYLLTSEFVYLRGSLSLL